MSRQNYTVPLLLLCFEYYNINYFLSRSSLHLSPFSLPSFSLAPSLSLPLARSLSLPLARSLSLPLTPSHSLWLPPSRFLSLPLAPSRSLPLALVQKEKGKGQTINGFKRQRAQQKRIRIKERRRGGENTMATLARLLVLFTSSPFFCDTCIIHKFKSIRSI
jgi:hypothetical protein